MSVFEGVVYHCTCLDSSNPMRPSLEVEAVVRDGDVDAGPLLLPWPDFVFMVGPEMAARCLVEFRRQDRMVDFLGVPHLAFTLWTAGEITQR